MFSVRSDDRLVRESRVKVFNLSKCIHIMYITPRVNETVLTFVVTSVVVTWSFENPVLKGIHS